MFKLISCKHRWFKVIIWKQSWERSQNVKIASATNKTHWLLASSQMTLLDTFTDSLDSRLDKCDSVTSLTKPETFIVSFMKHYIGYFPVVTVIYTASVRVSLIRCHQQNY